MMNKNERMNALNNAGVDTSKYFTIPLENGGSVTVIIDENGNPRKVDDVIANQIIEDGYVRNTKLHRRFVMAHMFQMLNYVSYDGKRKGYTEYLKAYYSYAYTFKMMLEEVRVLSKLEVRDKESFIERSHFFTKAVIIATMEDYMKKLEKHIKNLPDYNCKGIPYKKIKGTNIFNSDIKKKIYNPLYSSLNYVRYASDYNAIYKALSKFVNDMVKLPFDTPKGKEWVDAYKGAGAYYTLKNLVTVT